MITAENAKRRVALGDATQFILFMKNLAMAGGFLFLVAHGAGDWSLDARRRRNT